jgi:hypothetical protein
MNIRFFLGIQTHDFMKTKNIKINLKKIIGHIKPVTAIFGGFEPLPNKTKHANQSSSTRNHQGLKKHQINLFSNNFFPIFTPVSMRLARMARTTTRSI